MGGPCLRFSVNIACQVYTTTTVETLAHQNLIYFCDLALAIAMSIADPKNRSDFRDKTQKCCIAV